MFSRELIILQLEKAEGMSLKLLQRNVPFEWTSVKRFYGNRSFPFKVQPKFLKVLRRVEGCDPEQTVFSYKEIVRHFSKYILSNREEIFDPRSQNVALVRNNPLGAAFNVSAFHRCQGRLVKFIRFPMMFRLLIYL